MPLQKKRLRKGKSLQLKAGEELRQRKTAAKQKARHKPSY
jgi:hypothetical protein